MYVILKMPILWLNKKTKIPYYFSTTVSIFEFYIFYMFSFFYDKSFPKSSHTFFGVLQEFQ